MLLQEKAKQAQALLKETGLDCWMTFVKETSIHPDLLEPLGRLIGRAARESQLWITTHSETLARHIEHFTGAAPGPLSLVYAYLAGAPLDENACASATLWNFQKLRGFMWASGEIRCGSYNHYFLPNAQQSDCITLDIQPGPTRFTALGWKAARSRHSGGVNLALCDGSVRFVRDGIALATWRALATRAGGEVPGDF